MPVFSSVYINPAFEHDPWRPGDLLAFFHAQRTGGSALRHLLGAALGRSHVYCTQFVDDFEHWDVVDPERLRDSAVFAGHSNYRKRDFGRRVLPISLVRHPVYRTFSLYFYCKKYPNQFLHHLTEGRDIVEFYHVASRRKPVYFHNVMCRRIGGKPSFEAARAAVEREFYAIGATEALNVFASALFSHLGVEAPAIEAMPCDSVRYAHLLEEEDLIAQIKDANRSDVQLFEYLNETVFHLNESWYP